MEKTGIRVDTTGMTPEETKRLYNYLNKSGWNKRWQCFSSNEISNKVSTLIIQGVKTCGLNNDAYCYIEEQLTMEEAEDVSNFIGWCEANDKSFGHDNIDQVWSEWRK